MSDDHLLPSPEQRQDEKTLAKKKGGRPKKTEQEKQKHVVVLRFSDAQFAQLESHTRVKGQTLAGVVKKWMAQGTPIGLTAEQHACVRYLPGISNELKAIAALLKEQPDRDDKAQELLVLQQRLGQLLTSFQR